MDLYSGQLSYPGFPGWPLAYAYTCSKTPLVAVQRADELLAAGDMAGRAVWPRILEAVKELLETRPPGQVH